MSLDEAILAELREQTIWLRFLALPSVRAGLEGALDSAKKRAVYERSDGLATSREVGDAAGVAHVTVLRWWEEWARQGLVRPGVAAGRWAHLASLTALGIPLDPAG